MSPDVDGEWRKDLSSLMATKLAGLLRAGFTADPIQGELREREACQADGYDTH